MKIKITKDCYCEADMHEVTFYPRKGFKRKPMLKAGTEFLYSGEKYQNLYGTYFVVHTENGKYHIDPRNAEVIGNMPVWVAVDSTGKEAMHKGFCPTRHYMQVLSADYFQSPLNSPYKTIGYWVSEEVGHFENYGKKLYGLMYEREELEPGTIEQLIGKKLTFKDEPVQIE